MRGNSILLAVLATFSLGSLGTVSGCASADTETMPDGFALLAPQLDSVTPGAIALGDTVKIFGADFIDAQDGSMALWLDGTYTDSDGNDHQYVGEVPLTVVNSSVAEFVFEEIFFHPTRDKIGTWTGVAALVSRVPSLDDTGNDFNEKWSTDESASLRVEPSVVLTRLRSADDACPAVTFATNANKNIELGFRPIGFGEATPERPWSVRMTFSAPELQVRYVIPNEFDFWPINGPLNDSVSTLAKNGVHTIEFPMDTGDTIVLDPTATARTVKISPAVTIGQDVYDEVILGTMIAGPTPVAGKGNVNFVVEIMTDDARVLRRVVNMSIWQPIELGVWSGSERIAERYEANAVSGCVPGGNIGRDLTYSESESVTRTRSIDVRWNAQVSTALGAKLGLSGGVASTEVSTEQSWTQSFGIDISESVSSSISTGQDIRAKILPSFFAMSYRQLERLERTIDVIYHNECGQSGVIGEAQLTNWNFAFDIAQGKACPPDTNLPPAEIY